MATVAATLERKNQGDRNFSDRYKKQNQFVAVALTNGYAMTPKEAAAIDGPDESDSSPEDGFSISTRDQPQRFARQAFRGRILEGDVPSPHDFLLDPCELPSTTCPKYVAAIILDHTEFIVDSDYAEEVGTIEINDRVNVVLNATEMGPYNLERGVATSINRKRKYNKKRGKKAVDCTSLQDIFEGSSGHGSWSGDPVCTRGADEPHRTATDIMSAYGSSPFMTQELADAIEKTGKALGIDPAYLANQMSAESGFNSKAISGKDVSGPPYSAEDAEGGCAKDAALKPKKEGGCGFSAGYDQNSKEVIDCQISKCATGMIQFIPSTAAGQGTTTAKLYEMTAVKQMEAIQKYYSRYANDWGDDPQVKMFTVNFIPAALNAENQAKYGEGLDFNVYDFYEGEKPSGCDGQCYKDSGNPITYLGEYAAYAAGNAKLKC